MSNTVPPAPDRDPVPGPGVPSGGAWPGHADAPPPQSGGWGVPGGPPSAPGWAPGQESGPPSGPLSGARSRRPDPPRRRGAEPATVADARFAISLTAALVLFGGLLGLLWAVWTPTGPAAQIFPGGGFLTDETSEGVIAADGRFLAIVAPAGIITAGVAWAFARFRGPLTMFALGGGGVLGACAMKLVGGLAASGTYAGRRFTVNGTAYEVTRNLPLDVHTTGLIFVWPALAALVYGMLTAFAVRDDLGRPDPVRDTLVPSSVDPGGEPYGGGGHGDAAGALQQRDLPPQ